MKSFATIAVVLFASIAAMQLLRLLLGWEVTLNGMHVPFWLSGIVCVVTAGVSVMLWRESRR